MVTTNVLNVKSFLWLYNWRWLTAYYRMLALGATYEAAYDQADYEAGLPIETRFWSGYYDVEPEWNREEYIGS